MAITSFRDQYVCLSNFYPVDITMSGLVYPSLEHAYMASKSLDMAYRLEIRAKQTPGAAKRHGSNDRLKDLGLLREDWYEVNIPIMKALLMQKFKNNEHCREVLLGTGDEELVEGNYWHDAFWGVCNCGGPGFCARKQAYGENHLGLLLVEVRGSIRQL